MRQVTPAAVFTQLLSRSISLLVAGLLANEEVIPQVVCAGLGRVQGQRPLLLCKDSSLSVLHMYRLPYQQNLMSSVVCTLFSAIVPILIDCCLNVRTPFYAGAPSGSH